MLTVRLAQFSEIAAYERVPIRFEVRDILDIAGTPGQYRLTPRPSSRPYFKDYDAEPDERPSKWNIRFDVSNWQLFVAHEENETLGAAAVARATDGLHILEGRSDLAVLWDIRVRPDARRSGVGSALFDAAEPWSLEQGCIQLKVETQNTNAPACRFYLRHGCQLTRVNRGAYPTLPEEIQLVWYKELP